MRQTDVVLQANQNLTLNITLELGELLRPSRSRAKPRRSTSRSRRIAEVVDSKRIVELPLNGRDAARLSMLVSGMVVTEVDQESGKTIPGALRLSTNGTESRQASFRLDGTNHTDSYFQQNQPFPFPDALQEFSIQTQQLQRGAGRQRRRGRQRRHPLWNEQPPRRRVRLRARSHVQLEELLPARAGLPEAQTVRRLCGRPDHAQQDVLLRRLAGHDDSERRRHAEQHGADGRDARRRFQRHHDAAARPERRRSSRTTRFRSAGSIRPR